MIKDRVRTRFFFVVTAGTSGAVSNHLLYKDKDAWYT